MSVFGLIRCFVLLGYWFGYPPNSPHSILYSFNTCRYSDILIYILEGNPVGVWVCVRELFKVWAFGRLLTFWAFGFWREVLYNILYIIILISIYYYILLYIIIHTLLLLYYTLLLFYSRFPIFLSYHPNLLPMFSFTLPFLIYKRNPLPISPQSWSKYSDPACFIGVDGWGVMCL